METRRRTSARIGISVVSVLTLTLIGACSSSGGGTAADPGTSSASDIVVGDIGAYSGVLASDEAGIPTVMQAWADSVNAAGGIDGHQVKVISEDIGQTTGAGLTAAKELVEQDHVVAIVGDFDSGDTQWVPYVASQGVPIIGGAAALSDLTSSDRFPVVFNPITLIYTDAWIAAHDGGRLGIASRTRNSSTSPGPAPSGCGDSRG
jgi:branched-chain amino acid transport system substrate-binding protein